MSKRNVTGLMTVLFLIAAAATAGLFGLLSRIGLPPAHSIVSGAAMLVAELFAFRFVRGRVRAGAKEKQLVPAYLVQGTLIVLYGAAVLVITFVFGFAFRLSWPVYAGVQAGMLVLLAAGVMASGRYVRFVAKHETELRQRSVFMKQMKSSLHTIRELLALDGSNGEKELLHTLVEQLAERLSAGDPVSRPSVSQLEDSLLWQMRELENCVRLLRVENGHAGHLEMARQLAQDVLTDLETRRRKLRSEASRGEGIG
jgi:hypothetical protein